MRVMFDTNVLISMALFPSEKFSLLLDFITKEHTLILSSFVIEELEAVTDRKFPTKKAAVDKFLSQLNFEFSYTPHVIKSGLFEIRDINDYPVLYSAIIEDVDVLITGDKDLLTVEIEKPEILTPAEFVSSYI